MNKIRPLDLEYICQMIGNLAGIPIRIFHEGELTFFYSLAPLPKDPMAAHWKQVMAVSQPLGYYASEHFLFYAVVNIGTTKIVLGPTCQTQMSERELRELAFYADVAKEDTKEFLTAMKNIIHMPLESILQIMAMMYYCLTEEKVQVWDILSDRFNPPFSPSEERRQALKALYINEEAPLYHQHNSYPLEQEIMKLIRYGEVDKLESWAKKAPAIRGGILASNQLRQQKNLLIVAATLESRAAIDGGVDTEEAFSLSDQYIQKCEICRDAARLFQLHLEMAMDFAKRAMEIQRQAKGSPLAVKVLHYISHHHSDSISTDDLARSLYLSRTRLSAKFKEETGENLSEFILRQKIEVAKRLLRSTDKTATSIATYLGFSSQSHFTRTFQKYAGCSPREFRKQETLKS